MLYPSATTVQSGADAEPSSSSRNYLGLRIACWCVALVLGATDAWANRFTMNPDGVSYLDIGDAYWHGDWHNAINATWSPLYSWILGFFLKVVKPSAYWEYPLVHLVNFLIYVTALACFELLLTTYLEDRTIVGRRLAAQGQTGVPGSSWLLLGYSLFVSSGLIVSTLIAPDMCVAAIVFLAGALELRIRRGTASALTYLLLGLVLGTGYLAKAAMFPLAFFFLATALLAGGLSRRSLSKSALAASAFLCMCAPFIAALTHKQGHLTFSEVGTLEYEKRVDDVDPFTPTNDPALLHPVRTISDRPPTHEFATPISGTYPPTYDETYWHAGLKPRFVLKGQLNAIGLSLYAYSVILAFYANVTLPFLALLLIAPSLRSCWRRFATSWPLIVPCVAALAEYGIVYTEYRYVAPFIIVLWLAAFSSLALIDSPASKRLTSLAVIGITATVLVFQAAPIAHSLLHEKPAGAEYWQAADALSRFGVKPGDKIALIAPEPFGAGGAFVARLLRLHIIADTRRADQFWASDYLTRVSILNAFYDAGAKAVLAKNVPPNQPDWVRLGKTSFFVYAFTSRLNR